MKRKKRMGSAKRKFLRYTVGLVMYPFVLLIAPLYKWYRKVRYKKVTDTKYNDIVQGFSYLIVKDTEIERLAKERAEKCAGCKYAKYSGNLNTVVVGETIHQIKGMYCDRCGCSLAGKVRGENETCPIYKW